MTINVDVLGGISKIDLFSMSRGVELDKLVKSQIRAVYLELANYSIINISKFLRLKSSENKFSWFINKKGVFYVFFVLEVYIRENKQLIEIISI